MIDGNSMADDDPQKVKSLLDEERFEILLAGEEKMQDDYRRVCGELEAVL